MPQTTQRRRAISTMLFPAGLPFPAVFYFCRLDGLPLKIMRGIFTAACEGLDVIQNVARARSSAVASGRAGMFSFKRALRGLRAMLMGM